MNGHLFDIKLWIGDIYFGTKPSDNFWGLMNVVAHLEKLESCSDSIHVSFEIYILTPNRYSTDYKNQNQTDDIALCRSKGTLEFTKMNAKTGRYEKIKKEYDYNHFVHTFCAFVPIVDRPKIIDFLKTHGIKNTELLIEAGENGGILKGDIL